MLLKAILYVLLIIIVCDCVPSTALADQSSPQQWQTPANHAAQSQDSWHLLQCFLWNGTNSCLGLDFDSWDACRAAALKVKGGIIIEKLAIQYYAACLERSPSGN